MQKFLFTDGNGFKEAESQEELENLINSAADPEKIRVWLFNTSEWISYTAYRKLFPPIRKKELTAKEASVLVTTQNIRPLKKNRGLRLIRQFGFLVLLVGVAFLVFNFTRIKWKKADPVNLIAARPDNVPKMDIDSLISEIEYARGEYLDRSTKNNLRLRNTWPDRIELKILADREIKNKESRFSNLMVQIDNTTGVNLDKAIVKYSIWRKNQVLESDTLKISNIGYDQLSTRSIESVFQGDSISVSFQSIRARAFNFCYSATVENNSGNYNDRWFCRE